MPAIYFRAMGCQMAAHLDLDGPDAVAALADVPRWFEGWEQQLSRFRPDSGLSSLNAQAGQAVRVSVELWEVVQLALRVARLTRGLVVPTLLSALERAGYDRSFQQLVAGGVGAPGPAPGAADPPPTAWRKIRCLAPERAIQLPSGVRLDLGGVAKGWAAMRAAQALSAWGPALVDAGGDIAVSGPRADGQGWPVGVADPNAPDGLLAALNLRQGGVATSGRDYRRWEQGGAQQHHLIDARTGLPAQTDVLSATVIATELWQAEMAAKVLFFMGPAAGMAWLEARPHLAGLMVVENSPQPIWTSRRLADLEWR